MRRDADNGPKPGGENDPTPPRVSRVHKTLSNGRFHVYTSPDVVGLHASSDTMAEAQRQAIAILGLLAARQGVAKPVVDFLEEQAVIAA